ncbi:MULTISPECIES: type VII secretion system-associated protein [unclassified Streptomyces]|uniref:type VII secretion system-associated protein n=1 Tax=unclassified Streptomyces TaxID=2593676 RepID=UPI0036EB4600
MTSDASHSGDRWVAAEHIIDSVVVTGDGNIVIYYADGHHVEPAAPASRADAERLLFGPEPTVPTDRPWTWLTPEAGLHPLVSRPEESHLVEWARDGRGTALRLVCAPSGQGKTTLALRVCARLRDLGWTAGVLDIEQSPAPYAGGGEAVAGSLARSLRRWDRQLSAVAALPRLSGRALLVVDSAEVHRSRIEELLRTVTELPAAHGVSPVKLLLLARDTGEWWEELSVGSRRHHWIERRVMRLAPVTEGMTAAETGEVWRDATAGFAQAAERAGMSLAPGSTRSITEDCPTAVRTTLHLYAAALLRVLDAAKGRAASLDHREHPITGLVEHEQRYVAGMFTAAGLPISHDRARLFLALVCLYAPPDEQAALRVLRRVEVTAADGDLVRKARQLQTLYPGGGRSLWRAPGPDRLADSVLHALAAESRSDAGAERLFRTLCATDDWFEGRDCARVLLRALGTADEESAASATVSRRVGGAVGALVLDHPLGYVPAALETAADRFEQQILAAVAGHGGAAPASRLGVRELEALDLLLDFSAGSDSRARIAVAVSGRLSDAAQEAWQGVSRPWQAGDRLQRLVRYARGLQRTGDLRRASLVASEAVELTRRMRESGDAMVNGRIAERISRASGELAAAGMNEAALELSGVAVESAWSSLSSPDPLDIAGRAAILRRHSQRLYALRQTHEAAAYSSESLSLYNEAAAQSPGRYQLEVTGAHADYGRMLQAAHRPQQAESHLAAALAAYRRHLAADDRPGTRHALALVLLTYGVVLRDLGRTDQVLPPVEEAVELQRALAPHDPDSTVDLAAALVQLGVALAETGSEEAGRRPMEEAVSMLRGMRGNARATEELPNALANLGALYGECGDQERAVRLLEEALALEETRDARLGGTGDSLRTTARNLARALSRLGDEARAQAVHARFIGSQEDGPPLPAVRTAAEVKAHVPPVTDALRAAARRMTGGHLYIIDPAFDPQGRVPGHGIQGAFRVSPQGEITGFEANERYRPSPVALDFPVPTDPVDEAAQLALTGYGSESALRNALRSATVDVAPAVSSAAADRETAVFTSPGHLPDGIATTRISGAELLASLPVGTAIHINPASPVAYRFQVVPRGTEDATEDAQADAVEGVTADAVEGVTTDAVEDATAGTEKPDRPRADAPVPSAPVPPPAASPAPPDTPPRPPGPSAPDADPDAAAPAAARLVVPEDEVARLCARCARGEPVLDLLAAELRRSRVWYITSGGGSRHPSVAQMYEGRFAVFVYSSRAYASTKVLSFDPGARLAEGTMADVLREIPPATYVVVNNEGPHALQIAASALLARG